MLAGGVFWCIFAGNPTCTFENMDDDTSIEFGSSMVIRMRDIGCTRYVRDTLTLSDRHTGLQDVCTEFSNHVLVKMQTSATQVLFRATSISTSCHALL